MNSEQLVDKQNYKSLIHDGKHYFFIKYDTYECIIKITLDPDEKLMYKYDEIWAYPKTKWFDSKFYISYPGYVEIKPLFAKIKEQCGQCRGRGGVCGYCKN